MTKKTTNETNTAIVDDKLSIEAIKLDLAKFVRTKGGKIWVRNLARNAKIFSQGIFTGNSTTFYQEGKRDMVLSILRDVQEADPDAYRAIIEGIKL